MMQGHLSAGAFPSIHQEGAVGQAHGYARHVALERGRPRRCTQPRHRQTCQPCRQPSFSDVAKLHPMGWAQDIETSAQALFLAVQ